MAQPVLTLSTKGVLQDPKDKADRQMAYYLVSNHSQSNMLRDFVLSLPKRIQEFEGDVELLCAKIREDVQNLYRIIFDAIEVTVTPSYPNEADPNEVNLTVQALVTEAGTTYSLGRIINVKGNRTFEIMSINNTGIAQ